LRRRQTPASEQSSLLRLARRDPSALAGIDARIWVHEHPPPPDWAIWLARVQQVARCESQLGFWVGAEASPGTYIVDFEARRHPPGFRGIWRVLDDRPVATCSDGSILLGRRVQRIDGRRLGSHQTWRGAVARAQATTDWPADSDLQAFVERFLQREP
jgi:hypothetical protein